MRQTPEAVFDDGLIDLTVIRKISKFAFLSKIKRLYDGTIYEEKKLVAHTRGKSLEISAAPYSYMEVDGEPVGMTPVTVEIVPNAIKVVSDYR